MIIFYYDARIKIEEGVMNTVEGNVLSELSSSPKIVK